MAESREAMYYYAYLNSDDICIAIYAMPSPLSGDAYVQINSYDQSYVGQHYDRTSTEFEDVYYYAVLNEKNIVTSTVYYMQQQTATDTLRAITFSEYQTVTGLYWNGTEYITPPISIAAVASSDEINYKNQDKWLSTKLDEIDTAVAGKAAATHTHDISNVTGLTSNLTSINSDISDLETAVAGKANSSHTHVAADVSGVVKTINGNAPDTNGNITVTSGGMTASEILAAVETVDGSGSGLDADKLDGIEATGFATATHNHDDDYAAIDHNHSTVYAAINHTHSDYLTLADAADFLTETDLDGYATTTAMNTALSGKSDTTHNHNAAYATIDHTHTGYATTAALSALETDLDGKANSTHTHTQSDITGLTSALGGKSDTDHTHSLSSLGAASANHTHSNYLPTTGGTLSGNLSVSGVIRVGGQQAFYYASNSQTIGTNNATGGTTIACGSSADVVLNGARVQVPSLLPRNGGSFQIGNSSNRFSGIYLTNQPNVSSDERLKEAIKPIGCDDAAAFINGLEVVEYKYIGDTADRIGLIAQQIVKSDPKFAKFFVEQDEDGFYSIRPADLVFPLISAVQKLSKRISELESK